MVRNITYTLRNILGNSNNKMYPGVSLKCFSGGPTRHNAAAATADATAATTSAAAVAAAAAETDAATAATVTPTSATAAQPIARRSFATIYI